MTAATVDLPLCCPRTRPDITPTPSVCRQLFGPVDHERLKADHQREVQKLYEEQNLRWNFDFAKETPLQGRFSWQKLVATKETSSGCALVDTCEASARSHGCSSNEISGPNAGSQGDRSPNIDSKREVTRKRALTGKMTDFLRQKKCRLSCAEGKAATNRTTSRLTRKTTTRQGNLDNFVTQSFKVTGAEECCKKDQKV